MRKGIKILVCALCLFIGSFVLGGLTTLLVFGKLSAYLKTVALLSGGTKVDTSNFPNRWETGMLFDSLYTENPFIITEHIANNGTHTFKSYNVNLPPFGVFQTRWYRVSNQEWLEFEEELNKPLFYEHKDGYLGL